MQLPQDQNRENKPDSPSAMLKRIWAPVTGFIGAVVAIVQFIDLWKGNRDVVSLTTSILGIIAISISLIFISFSKIPSPIFSSRQIPRYPAYYKIARLGLLVLLATVISGGTLLYRQDLILRDKLVVLVANIDGPDLKNYRVTEYLLANLNQSVEGYEDVIIKPLGKEITEQEGSELAKDVGNNYRADIVIWGWYGVTETDVVITVHVENLIDAGFEKTETNAEKGIYQIVDNRKGEATGINSDKSQITQAGIGNINSFSIQAQLATETSSLISFFSGYLRYNIGDYAGALIFFDDAVNQDKDLKDWSLRSQIYFYRGNTHFWLRNLDLSISDLTVAINAEEDLKSKSLYHANRGVSYIHAGLFQDAIKDYSAAIDFDPESPLLFLYYNNRGSALKSLGEYEDAIRDLTKSIELNSSYEAPYYNRGSVYLKQEKYDLAITDFNQAIKYKSNNYDAFVDRGMAYLNIGNFDKAREDLEMAEKLNPGDAIVYINLGALYSSMGEKTKAIDYYNLALQSSPEFADAYYNRANAYSDLEEYDKAIQDYTKVISLNPLHSAAYNGRGVTYLIIGEFENAIQDLTKAIEYSPNMYTAYGARGVVYEQKEELELALDDFQKAIEINPNYTYAYFRRGIIYNKLLVFDKAIPDFTMVLEDDPQNQIAYVERGWAYANIRDFEKSLVDLNRAVELDANDVKAYYYRGSVLCDSGDKKNGRLDLEKVVEMDKDGYYGAVSSFFLNSVCISGQQESSNNDIEVTKTKTPTIEYTPTIRNSCGTDSPLDLKIGDVVKVVTTDDLTLSIRDHPGLETTILERLKSESTLEIIDGPECKNNYRWWKVKFTKGDKQIIGWVAEGDSKEKYLVK